ncbi:MAG: hypothetical protein JWO15_3530 [Sphingomonadales bacterium]|nr:hypothetical protein [Sphingomonadales bacterium]
MKINAKFWFWNICHNCIIHPLLPLTDALDELGVKSPARAVEALYSMTANGMNIALLDALDGDHKNKYNQMIAELKHQETWDAHVSNQDTQNVLFRTEDGYESLTLVVSPHITDNDVHVFLGDITKVKS